MKHIPFHIIIRKREYKGYLQSDSVTVPPNVFFVFVDNFIIGNLICTDVWDFQQVGVGVRFSKFTEDERKEIAAYLGNIAVEAYQ